MAVGILTGIVLASIRHGSPFLVDLMPRPHALRVGSGHETNMGLQSVSESR